MLKELKFLGKDLLFDASEIVGAQGVDHVTTPDITCQILRLIQILLLREEE